MLAGLLHFTTREPTTGQKHYDREALVGWARERFEVELAVDDLRNKQREEVHAVLIEAGRRAQQRADEAAAQVQARLDELFTSDDASRDAPAASNGRLTSVIDWLRERFQVELNPDDLRDLDREAFERRLTGAVEDRYRPEMRGMERALVLQLLDTAWKEHLLAMDHLRSSVGLRGYAQVDPKVEYRREGMRIFEAMWDAVGDHVTDLVFRIEQLDEGFVGSTWVDSRAVHDAPAAAGGGTTDQMQAVQNSENVKIEPIRNREEAVGRNDPCPCGSGKKYKQCCLRK